ncbi:MAG: class I SAM-dependent methyltransferase [Candidatus Rokuibacteriota bacterium]
MKGPGAIALPDADAAAVTASGRRVRERLVALGYGWTYDAIVGGFPPYQRLLDEVAHLVGRALADVPDRRSRKVLDISCGTGTVAARLARDGYRVLGVDSVAHLVDVAQRRHGASATFRHLDVARDTVPESGTYDALVSMHTLYWHPNPHGVLEACRRLLKPGGHGVFLTYTRPARVGRTFGRIRARQGTTAALRALRWLVPTAAFETFRHYDPQYLTREEFGLALGRAGFEVLELRETFLAGLSLLAWGRANR